MKNHYVWLRCAAWHTINSDLLPPAVVQPSHAWASVKKETKFGRRLIDLSPRFPCGNSTQISSFACKPPPSRSLYPDWQLISISCNTTRGRLIDQAHELMETMGWRHKCGRVNPVVEVPSGREDSMFLRSTQLYQKDNLLISMLSDHLHSSDC